LNDNGAWLVHTRRVVNDAQLIIGSVRAVGSNQANVSDPDPAIEIGVCDIGAARQARSSFTSGTGQSTPGVFREPVAAISPCT
jgi:hypothetical protein